jgi:hypothetical protein
MNKTLAFVCLFCILFAISLSVEGQEFPTSLTCTSNAKASRDYGFVEERWTGEKGHLLDSSTMFRTFSRNNKTSWGQFKLRDKVFYNLDATKPIVRSITRFQDGTKQEAAFVGRVVERTPSEVFIVWTNEFNKVWLAAVDLEHRKVVVTHVFRGATSVGGEIETLDCR